MSTRAREETSRNLLDNAINEILRLRKNLQKIADLPLRQRPCDGKKPEPRKQARRIAIAALKNDRYSDE
jgi:hypothetical protein